MPLLPTLWGHLQMADMQICEALDIARRLSQDTTWQDCAGTTEIGALRYLADLLELRQNLIELQGRANKPDIAPAQED